MQLSGDTWPIIKTLLSSDWSLQPDSTKLDSLVIAHQPWRGEYVPGRYAKGEARGQLIEPLYPSVPEAALRDEELYQLLVIADTLRMGRSREKEIAIAELNKHIQRYVENQ